MKLGNAVERPMHVLLTRFFYTRGVENQGYHGWGLIEFKKSIWLVSKDCIFLRGKIKTNLEKPEILVSEVHMHSCIPLVRYLIYHS